MPYIEKETLLNAIDMINDVTGTHKVTRYTEREVVRRMAFPFEIETHDPRDYVPITDIAQMRIDEIKSLLQSDGSYYSKPQRLIFFSPKRISKEMLNDDVGDYHWRDIQSAQNK